MRYLALILALVAAPAFGGESILLVTPSGYYSLEISDEGIPIGITRFGSVIDLTSGVDPSPLPEPTPAPEPEPKPESELVVKARKWADAAGDPEGREALRRIYGEATEQVVVGDLTANEAPKWIEAKTTAAEIDAAKWEAFRNFVRSEAVQRDLSQPENMAEFLSEIEKGLAQ